MSVVVAPRFTDVSLTDGQGARWAGALTTPMALAVASRLVAARPAAIEVASPATLQQCVARGEDPWQRIALLRERCGGVRLRAAMALLTEHGQRGADAISTDVATLWLRELQQRGVTEVVLIDPLLDVERMSPVLQEARKLGLTAIAALPFVPQRKAAQKAAALAAKAEAGEQS